MNHPHSDIELEESPATSGRKLHTRMALLLLAMGGVGAAVHLGSHASAADEKPAAMGPPPATAVTVSAVEQRTLTDHRELLGRVEAVESVEIRPRVSGHIDEVHLVSGQIVEKGDLLFQIDPRWYKAQFDLATAAVQKAQVRVEITEKDAKRSQSLLGVKAISVEIADTRESLLAEAKAELLSAQANLDTARLDLEYTQVRSPIKGRVSRALVTAGNLVSGVPGGGTLLTTVVSTGDAYVYADVDETTSLTFEKLKRAGALPNVDGKIPVDMQLSDETDYPHHGYIESANNRLDANTGTLVYRMVFPNVDDKLVPGLFARVRLPISAPQTTLLVSERAIGTDQSQKFVFTVGSDNLVAYKSVKLGPVVDGKRIIREGLNADEKVIVNGLQRVRPGVTVTATM
jgi:RND family efflux transporter MFP subunit